MSEGFHDQEKGNLQVRTLVQRDFERALAAVDALISPVAPTAAYRLGQASNPNPLSQGRGYIGAVISSTTHAEIYSLVSRHRHCCLLSEPWATSPLSFRILCFPVSFRLYIPAGIATWNWKSGS